MVRGEAHVVHAAPSRLHWKVAPVSGLVNWKAPVVPLVNAAGRTLMVVMETKGAHLANEDTEYKRKLMQILQSVWSDERLQRAGELELVGKDGDRLMCDLVFDQNWRNELTQRWFAESS